MVGSITSCTSVGAHISSVAAYVASDGSRVWIGAIATICGSYCTATAVAAIIVRLCYRNH